MRKLLEGLGAMRRLQRSFWIVAAGALLLALAGDWWRSHQLQPAAPDEAASDSAVVPPGARGPHRVVVRVVDEGGEPVRGARVYAPQPKDAPQGPPTPAVEFEPGRHVFAGLESGEVEIVVELAGDRFHLMHPTDKGTATLPVPTGGRVALAWALPPKLELGRGRVILALEPASENTDRFEVPVPPAADNHGSLMVPYVVPGEYLAHLEFWQEATLTTERASVIPLTSPIELEVEPRTLTRIALGLGPDEQLPKPAPVPAPAAPAAAKPPAAAPPAAAPARAPAPPARRAPAAPKTLAPPAATPDPND